jgi:hypothetical protein
VRPPAPPEAFAAAAAARQAELVGALFAALGAAAIPYAILRNHERFPRFGHDVDLVVRPADVAAVGRVLAEAGRAAGCAAVTLCRHWASPVPPQGFEALWLWDLERRAALKLDLFHGWHVQGLALLDAEALLGTARGSACGRYRHIDPALEQALRLLQIKDQLAPGRAPSARLLEFRERALAEGAAARAWLERLLPEGGPVAFDRLAAGDWPGFSVSMAAARRAVVRRALRQRPLSSMRDMTARALGIARSRLLQPCGFTLDVAGLADGWPRLERALRELHAAGMLFTWHVAGHGAHDLRARLATRHLSGLVLRPVRPGAADLDLAAEADDAALFRALARRLIARHPPAA